MSFLVNSFSKCCSRGISTSVTFYGKRNFRKFLLYNKRGSRLYKQQKADGTDSQIPTYTRGVREIGYNCGQHFIIVPEMIPELIVPELSGFDLKPYVSYRAPNVFQTEYNAKDLFDAMYGSKITENLKSGKLDEDDEPSSCFKGTFSPEEAKSAARRAGSDLF